MIVFHGGVSLDPTAELRLLEICADEESYAAHGEAAHTREWSAFVPGAAIAPPKFDRIDLPA